MEPSESKANEAELGKESATSEIRLKVYFDTDRGRKEVLYPPAVGDELSCPIYSR